MAIAPSQQATAEAHRPICSEHRASYTKAPITLKVGVDCRRHAKKVRKAIQHMDGVNKVLVYENGTITVIGNRGAEDLERRIESKLQCIVTIVRAGAASSSGAGAGSEGSDSPPTHPVPQGVPPYAPPPMQPYGGGLPEQGGGSAWGPEPTVPTQVWGPPPGVPTEEWAHPQYQSTPNDVGHYLSDENANGCSIM